MIMATIELDGKTLEVEPGKMIIEVADAAGIYIPRFCYHDKLSIAANCRMCLVEVEKAPKPLPACATPVTDGMKVFTASPLAVGAQKGTMEFLLINHPLDCPVCDQGGECPLQDQAMGFGKDVSRFTEKKRAVEDEDIGPLIETELTRCIHCTRCVRFGQEIAGVMELGMTGRGEHAEISTFLGQSVDSEVSGNMIDLCPVGALTNKPYRFTARSWELTSHNGVSPHDCLGTNINIQSLRDEVKRILPRSNESINECWIADRDRYSYEGLNSDDRLTTPLIKSHGKWKQADWESALVRAVSGLKKIIDTHGAGQIGALASPLSTLEEFYLLQKLVRGLASNNVDHRLRQLDFADDHPAVMRPWLGCSIQDLETARTILLVGSNIRKEQPLLGLRIRRATLNGAKVMAVNALDYEFNFELADKALVLPSQLPAVLASIVVAAANGLQVAQEARAWAKPEHGRFAQTVAQLLMKEAGNAVIVMGSAANSHPQASVLRGLVRTLAQLTQAKWGCAVDANGAAAWVAGCVPHRTPAGELAGRAGCNALDMIRKPLRGYLLMGLEPVLDCIDGNAAANAMRQAECVVALTAYDIRANTNADVLLPITPFSETPGTYINCEGRAQSVSAAVPPQGEARPAWKVLRVLGNLFDLEDFSYITSEQVRDAVNWSAPASIESAPSIELSAAKEAAADSNSLELISDVPLYRVDPVVRRANALQATADNLPVQAFVAQHDAQRMGVVTGDQVIVQSNGVSVHLTAHIDSRVPAGGIFIPGGYDNSAQLAAFQRVEVAKS